MQVTFTLSSEEVEEAVVEWLERKGYTVPQDHDITVAMSSGGVWRDGAVVNAPKVSLVCTEE